MGQTLALCISHQGQSDEMLTCAPSQYFLCAASGACSLKEGGKLSQEKIFSQQ